MLLADHQPVDKSLERAVSEGVQRWWGLLPSRRKEKLRRKGDTKAGRGRPQSGAFLGSRKHNGLSCFNLALQSWIKYCKWCCTGTCCTKRCTEHAVCPVPHRDCLRLTGEKEYTCKTSHKSEIQHHLRHYHPHSKQLVSLTCLLLLNSEGPPYASPSEKKSGAELSNFSDGNSIAMQN